MVFLYYTLGNGALCTCKRYIWLVISFLKTQGKWYHLISCEIQRMISDSWNNQRISNISSKCMYDSLLHIEQTLIFIKRCTQIPSHMTAKRQSNCWKTWRCQTKMYVFQVEECRGLMWRINSPFDCLQMFIYSYMRYKLKVLLLGNTYVQLRGV